MKTYLGEEGLKQSWQEDFPKSVFCRCGGKAHIAFVGCENERKSDKFICNLHKTSGKEGGLWVHDAVAVGLYICTSCLHPTAILNQA